MIMLQRKLLVVIKNLILIHSSLIQKTGQYMGFIFVGVLACRMGFYKNGAKHQILNRKTKHTAKEQECTESGKSTSELILYCYAFFNDDDCILDA